MMSRSRWAAARGVRRHRGFTMTELLTVMGIISVAVTIAIPAMRMSENRRTLRTDILTVQRMMQFARSEAVATRRFVALEFDLRVFPEADRLRFLGDAQWNAGLSRWEGSEIRGGLAHQVDVPNDIQELRVGGTTHMTGVHSLVFSPTGACALDDGSVAGPIEMDIVRMGT